MTVSIDVCDHPLFRRLAKERIRGVSGTFYEMDNRLYTDDITRYTDDITKAKRLTDGNFKHTNFCYCVGDSHFVNYDDAIVHSMMLLILADGFSGFKVSKGSGVTPSPPR